MEVQREHFQMIIRIPRNPEKENKAPSWGLGFEGLGLRICLGQSTLQ